jgi:hypothetical protein
MKMGFEKGHIKYGGRQRGVKNATTKELKSIISDFIAEQLEGLPSTFNTIESPERRLELLIKLLPFVLPKAQEISLEMLSDSKLDFLVETLKNEKEREN